MMKQRGLQEVSVYHVIPAKIRKWIHRKIGFVLQEKPRRLPDGKELNLEQSYEDDRT